MGWQKGQSGNPAGRKQEKLYRDALRMELAAAGDNMKAAREIAKVHIARAKAGDMQAIKEFADRIDGKVPQGLIGDDDGPPVRHLVQWQKDDDE